MGLLYTMSSCWVCHRPRSKQHQDYICDACTAKRLLVPINPGTMVNTGIGCFTVHKKPGFAICSRFMVQWQPEGTTVTFTDNNGGKGYKIEDATALVMKLKSF